MKAGSLLLFFILLWSGLSAQKPGFFAGVEGGFSFNTPVYDYDTTHMRGSSLSGLNITFCGGPYLLCKFSNRFSFKTAAWYQGETLQYTWVYYPEMASSYGRYTREHYTSGWKIPLLLRFNMKKNSPYFIDIGPCINFTSDRNDTYIRNSSYEDSLAESNSFHEISYGMCVGFGSFKKLQPDLFWSWEAVYSLNNRPTGNTLERTHGDLNLFIGLAYRFSKKVNCHTF
jgi:hypothetical protein